MKIIVAFVFKGIKNFYFENYPHMFVFWKSRCIVQCIGCICAIVLFPLVHLQLALVSAARGLFLHTCTLTLCVQSIVHIVHFDRA